MSQDELFPGARIERERHEVNAASDRHEQFIAAYLVNGHNATKAAIAAGYSEKTAYSQGSRLLRNAEIAKRLANTAEKVAEETVATAREVLLSVTSTLRYDVRKMVNGLGGLRSIADLEDCEAHAIEGLGYDAKTGLLTKVKLASRAGAQDKLMRHHALYKDKVEVEVAIAKVIVPLRYKEPAKELPTGPQF